MTELEQIKQRMREHYSRGLGEPVGLPRVVWVDDTKFLIGEVERLQRLLDMKSEYASIENLARLEAQSHVKGDE